MGLDGEGGGEEGMYAEAEDDEADGRGGHNRGRLNAPIGSRVQILWPKDNSWYTGTVHSYKGSLAVV